MIDAELQQRLYDKHPANVVRLILNKDEPGDDEHNNRYTRAARLMRSWLREGVLFTEADPAIYVYHQVFNEGGIELHAPRLHVPRAARAVRRGQHLPARRNARRRQGRPAEAVDRVQGKPQPDLRPVSRSTRTKPRTFWKSAIAGVAPLEATDHLGVVHRIWPVTDVATITAVIAAMGDRPVYIADGHHRYETACTLRDQIAASLLSGGDACPPSTRPTTC